MLEQIGITTIIVLNAFIAIFIIFMERKNPSATLAWILILFFAPVVGIILYLFLSQNIARSKIFKINDDINRFYNVNVEKQNQKLKTGNFTFRDETAKKWSHLITLNQTYGESLLTQDNDVRIFDDGKRMYASLLRDIKLAEKSINIEYFIIKNDPVGNRLLKLLVEKAREGVKVRLIMDALGSVGIKDRKLREFVEAGGEYQFYFKPKIRIINTKLNYRNHRKIVVIDDKVGYVGGFNVAKEYLGYKKKFGYWRDAQFRITGSAVKSLNIRLLMDWNVATGSKVDISKEDIVPSEEITGAPIQIVSSGPDSEKQEIKRAMMKMITYAKDSIYIQTPYFIPDSSMLESLKMAAQSGVEVNIMIPHMPDHIFVYWATYSYVGELIRDGAKVFIYDKGFLHAKTLVVDSEVATLGSCNFDRRSFKLNFETNAFVYDEEVSSRMEACFKKDLENCHQLTLELYEKRSRWIKFKESVSRLLSDIL
ncbi:MAG: cardiolipin synthase [Clostridia bacterium]|nr:cardiolipin synthase [Clostridia bacterium]